MSLKDFLLLYQVFKGEDGTMEIKDCQTYGQHNLTPGVFSPQPPGPVQPLAQIIQPMGLRNVSTVMCINTVLYFLGSEGT